MTILMLLMKYIVIFHADPCNIPYSGYFGGEFLWMLGFVVIRGNNGGRLRSKPHPSCTRRAMASSFEVKSVV